jgi:hypothetical protein
VADRQRLGMKMKLHRNRLFAGWAKLATSEAINGNLPVHGVRPGIVMTRARCA